MPKSEETRAKISAAQRGEPRPWQRGEKNPMWGRTGYQNPAFKPDLLLFERVATGERFKLTRRKAVEQLGLPKSGISDLIAGRRPTAKGFRIFRDPE